MSIARHTTYNVIGAILPLAVSVVTVPLYLRIIGTERYGILALCWTLLGFMGFLSVGIGPAVAQRLAALHDASESERANVFWTAFFLTMVLAACAGFIGYLAGKQYFATLPLRTSSLSREVGAALPWLAMIIPLALTSSVLSGALQGRYRFLSLNVINTTGSVLMAVLPLAVAYSGGARVQWLVVAGLVAKLTESGLLFIAASNAVPLGRVRPPQLPIARQLLQVGGWISVSSVLGPALENTDRFMIGAILGARAVAAYTIGYNLVSRLGIIPSSLARALYPRFASSELENAQMLEVLGARAVVAVMTPVAIVVLAILGPFLRLWLGDSLALTVHPPACILIVGFWMNSVAQVPYVSLQGSGRPDLPAKLQIAYLVPYFTVLYFAVKYFGLVGAAVAWTLRSCCDPALFLLSGTFERVWRLLLPGTVLVVAACLVAVSTDWRLPIHWLAMAGLLLPAVLRSIQISPVPASDVLSSARRMLAARARIT